MKTIKKYLFLPVLVLAGILLALSNRSYVFAQWLFDQCDPTLFEYPRITKDI